MVEKPEGTRRKVVSSSEIDALVESAVFGPTDQGKETSRARIRELALSCGIYPASIHGLYQASGKGLYRGKSVPAFNLRVLIYDMARAAFRAALKHEVGAFVFEIARSEIGYTKQRPAEYSACVLAAAIREGFKGPVFIQGDHFQVSRSKYASDPEREIKEMESLVRDAVGAGFFNIDIDASTTVDIEKQSLAEQQENNFQITARMTEFIRSIEPEGTTVSIGGEIGEVGKRNSTVEDLEAFMSGYQGSLGPGTKGIVKISVQTGTSHGGVVLPDGSIAKVELDFDTLSGLSRAAREKYGMGGAVQHGASTLPDEMFHLFPETGTLEVHLATAFQNLLYESPHFPKELTDRISQHLLANYANERKPGDTDEQFLYQTRKKALGDFKREIWGLPKEDVEKLGQALEERFSLLYQKLNVVDTVDLVNKYVPRRGV